MRERGAFGAGMVHLVKCHRNSQARADDMLLALNEDLFDGFGCGGSGDFGIE